VTSPFFAPFKLTLVAALFIAMPFLLHQAWSFIAPGLYKHEKHLALPLLVSSILLFYLGIAFAYFAVFPIIFGFFTSAAPAGVLVMTDVSSYLDFVLTLFLAFGVAFEVPVVVVLLVMGGFAEVATLQRARPYLVVIAFVIGMVLTPPDIFSQAILALPMCLLFEVGLLVARLLVRRRMTQPATS
jgi:sec-independent protein translocase protein TatC